MDDTGAVDACPYRSLIERIEDYTGKDAFANLLVPWLEAHPGEQVWLASLLEAGREAVPAIPQEQSWRLYALSRLCESLVMRLHASEADPDAGCTAPLSMREVEEFFSRLHIHALKPGVFTPFHHEIVGTIPARDPCQAPCIQSWHWPCFTLGPLLIMRAGVTVSAGARVLAPGIADTSTLYWAYERQTRPAHDLSHGWGSSSAWRTAFRRDYQLGGVYHFNVDAPCDLARVDPQLIDKYGLSTAERIELLIYRSFLTSPKEHADLFPYNERISIPVSSELPTSTISPWRRLIRRLRMKLRMFR